MAITLNIKKQLPLSSIISITSHSDVALLVKTNTGEDYFASLVENDQTNGVATLAPVNSVYDIEDDEDEFDHDLFEDDYDFEDDLLP